MNTTTHPEPPSHHRKIKAPPPDARWCLKEQQTEGHSDGWKDRNRTEPNRTELKNGVGKQERKGKYSGAGFSGGVEVPAKCDIFPKII